MNSAFARLRILLAIGIYQPGSGGASEWLQQYARWLSNRGHKVCIACERAEISAPESFALLTLSESQHTKNSLKRAAALEILVEQFPADIIHDTGCLVTSDIFHPLMGSLIHNWHRQLQTYPLALRLRRFWHVRLWRDVLLQWHQIRRQQILIACSQKTASDFAQLGCKNAIVIANGIRTPASSSSESIQQLRQKLSVDDRLLALVTANNFYLKGVMTVLRAFSQLDADTRKNFLVIIAGHNSHPEFQEYIQQHHLQDCCYIAGWVKNIDDYYQAADIFLHPTYHDAGSLSTLKAIAAGCAVVTSRFDGSAEGIKDGITGLILNKPDDTAELKKNLLRLLNPEFRNQLGTAARQLTPSLNQENQFQKLETLYFNAFSKHAA